MSYLYVMLSRTDTGMGRFIRFFTREEYNHVSLCVDDSLQKFVSFARYRQDTPLAGGAVAEPPQRLLSCGEAIPVRIFRLKITKAEAQQLEDLFAQVEKAPLVYNSLGALLKGFHISCSIPGTYTCLEFAGAVLGITPPSIHALGAALEPWEYYQGDLFELLHDNGDRSDSFFEHRGFWKASWDTSIHFKTLLWRTLRLERPRDPIAECSFNILTNALQIGVKNS